MNPLKWKLHWQILLGLAVGALLGWISAAVALSASAAAGIGADGELVAPAEKIVTSRWDFLLYKLGGDLFMNGLKLIIVPLVTSSIILAVVGIGAASGFGRLSLKALAYYLTTSTIAILIGLTLVNLIAPGATESGKPLLTVDSVKGFESEAAEIEAKAGGRSGSDFLDVFRAMVPPNVFAAAADNGQLLGLIIVSLLIGYFLVRLSGPPLEAMKHFWQAVHDITLAITELVLRFAPLGVGMLLAGTVAQNYAKLAQEARFDEFIGGIVSFSITALVALGIHLFVVMPLIICFLIRVNPLKHFKAMAPALMTAFSTASSSATLPVTMECVEDNAGVSKKTTSFVLPLGATVNMDGTALYECVAAIFIAQAFGVDLTFGQQFLVVVVALFTSVGVAGVPSASLVAIVIILKSLSDQIGIPLEAGLPILLVFDRLLDMCRTAVNVFSDSVGATFIATTEGETGLYPESGGGGAAAAAAAEGQAG